MDQLPGPDPGPAQGELQAGLGGGAPESRNQLERGRKEQQSRGWMSSEAYGGRTY